MLRELTRPERARYFAGMQPLWGGGLPVERFIQYQEELAHSAEAHGRYRLLGWEEGGQVRSGMKAYQLSGTCAGSPLKILGIGAVFTPPELRRAGAAFRMLSAALSAAAADGYDCALLFSDIGEAYYERLGFWALESPEAVVAAEQLPRGEPGRIAQRGDEPLFDELLGAARVVPEGLALDRDGWSLRFQLRRIHGLVVARGGVNGVPWGVRAGESAAAVVRPGREGLDVLDAGWVGGAARDQLLAALRDTCLRLGAREVRFWPARALRDLAATTPRTSAIAMVARLREGAPVPERGGPAELALLDHI